METEVALNVVKAAQSGNIPGIIAIIGFAWAMWERRENRANAAVMLEFAKAQVESTVKMEAALTALRDKFL